MKYFIIILCLAFTGCEESISKDQLIKQNSDGMFEFYEQKVSNNGTQIIETVSRDNIISWIKSHPSIYIDTMTLVHFGGSNMGYIVVYREITPNKVEK